MPGKSRKPASSSAKKGKTAKQEMETYSSDEFADRDMIGFDAAPSSDDEEQEEAVFDIGGAASDSDDDDEADDFDEGDSDDDDEDNVPKKGISKKFNPVKSGKARKVAQVSSDDEESEDEDEADDDTDTDSDILGNKAGADLKFGWGTKRRNFYDADTATHQLDEQDALDEEEEAIRLQQKRAEGLEDDDFMLGGMSTKAPATSNPATAAPAAGKPSAAIEKIARNTDNLTKEEKLQLIQTESPELLTLLQDMKARIAELQQRVYPVLDRVRSGSLPTDNGVSFLEVKYQVLLSYVINIVFYLLMKAEGKPVKDHPVMDQLHHIRTILERIKPVDAKLKNQISRLVKAASAEPGAEDGGHKPRPQALVSHAGDKKGKRGDDSDIDSDDEGNGGEDEVYKPLKRTAVLFDDGKTSKAEREEERRKARASKSKLFRDLLEQYTDKPEELHHDGELEAVDETLKRTDEDRRRFEEDNFVRLTVPKGEKSLRKKRERERQRVDPLRDLTSGFAEIERLAGGGGGSDDDMDAAGGDKFYSKASNQLAKKKQAKTDAVAARAKAESDAAANAYVEKDVDGERRASKDILKNRGLTKYRNKDRKNPRKNQRMKFEKAVKRRTGQVAAMRTGEGGRYGGEALGIRTTVSRSHKIA